MSQYIRVVRFTDVSPDRMQDLVTRIDEADGPPPGVSTTSLKLLVDERQGTAIAIQEFSSAADMDAGGKVLGAMDSSDTPGTRVSGDECEVKLELDA